jgi:serine/threonine protein kinase
MQQLRNSATGEVFARKILQLGGFLRIEDLKNEIRAVDKLRSAAKPHEENIVIVTRHGTLSSSSLYFFDMELCDFNLEHYITVLWEPNNLEKMYSGWQTESTVDWSSRLSEIWIIMSQIAHGVAFIHRQKEVHRDLKPRNGIIRAIHRPSGANKCAYSPIFRNRSSMEDCRFWFYVGGKQRQSELHSKLQGDT